MASFKAQAGRQVNFGPARIIKPNPEPAFEESEDLDGSEDSFGGSP